MTKGVDSTDEVMHIWKSGWFCNEEDTDGRAKVTADEERVLYVDW